MSIIEELEAEGEVLAPRVRAVLEVLQELPALVASLQERVLELEARLRQNSTNSSLPPSSDPPGVLRAPKKPTGRTRGGQPGHPGHHRKMIAAERVDEVCVHRPPVCTRCGSSLAAAEAARPAQVHQTVELPPLRAYVVEHRMECLCCPRCGTATRASLPKEVDGKHFGPHLVALGSELSGRYRMSRREVVDLLGRLLDVAPPSLGSTEAFAQESSTALAPLYATLKEEVRQSEGACVDETPWKRQGKKHWLWVAVTQAATLFHLGPSRGAQELRNVLGEYAGRVSSDRWCAYQIYARRQLCWAHLVRNFRRLALRGAEAAAFAARGEAACDAVFARWWQWREADAEREALQAAMRPIRDRLRRLLVQGSVSAQSRVAGLSRNLLKLWGALWTFTRESVELTNNAAERALRPAVLWRKGCFGSQSEAGLRCVERMLTLNATCRQRQIDPIEFLARALLAKRTGATAPALLPTH